MTKVNGNRGSRGVERTGRFSSNIPTELKLSTNQLKAGQPSEKRMGKLYVHVFAKKKYMVYWFCLFKLSIFGQLDGL